MNPVHPPLFRGPSDQGTPLFRGHFLVVHYICQLTCKCPSDTSYVGTLLLWRWGVPWSEVSLYSDYFEMRKIKCDFNVYSSDLFPRRALGPGMGDIAMPPSVCLSVHPSVCLSVTFSFRTVTRKRIDVFSRNFAGTCTMSWGCAV